MTKYEFDQMISEMQTVHGIEQVNLTLVKLNRVLPVPPSEYSNTIRELAKAFGQKEMRHD